MKEDQRSPKTLTWKPCWRHPSAESRRTMQIKEVYKAVAGWQPPRKKTGRHGRIRERYSGKHGSDRKRSRSRGRKISRNPDRRNCRSVECRRGSRSRDRSIRCDRGSRSPRSDRRGREQDQDETLFEEAPLDHKHNLLAVLETNC
ncbi:hypothetical protein JTE90_006410 [Oedothorax gibbosus]|uniref:Uncharacterized protein n=1 Tax=Oedothorax gibbosus TaxID=931172 RepID=A0AAV6VZ47_9ARAC|nr:hypothetical protein JTE90_006410 [Oedothorax gibbosus]